MGYSDMPESDKLLARYFEKKGWWYESYGNGGGYWHNHPHKQKMRGDGCTCGSRILPRIDTDANAAIAEADSTFQYRWSVKRNPGDFVFFTTSTSSAWLAPHAYATGKTFCEAILTALIKRAEEKK